LDNGQDLEKAFAWFFPQRDGKVRMSEERRIRKHDSRVELGGSQSTSTNEFDKRSTTLGSYVATCVYKDEGNAVIAFKAVLHVPCNRRPIGSFL